MGTFFSLLGALVVALHLSWSKWGFVAFLISNVTWIAFSLLTRQYHILAMQLGFATINIVGLFRWML